MNTKGFNRRRFLQAAGAIGGLGLIGEGRANAATMINVKAITDEMFTPSTPLTPEQDMFRMPLVVPPVLTASPGIDLGTGRITDFYKVDASEFYHQFSPGIAPTKVWGYKERNSQVQGYLGGIIFAKRGRPVRINFRNLLPPSHPLPVDTSIEGYPKGPNGVVNNAISVHLHGGHVPWQSDGHPLAWFTDDPRVHGPYFDPFKPVFMTPWQGQVGHNFWYPNDQPAAFRWYHDHAVGLTRLNAYAGLASAYIVRDQLEEALTASGQLPPSSRELFLVVQDKAVNKDGSLWYPSVPDPQSLEEGVTEIPFPSAAAEMMGDVNIVNGVVWPKVSVDRARYRLRILNGAQSRAYRLGWYYALPDGITPNFKAPGPALFQIGTEAGFLPLPTAIANQTLLMAPAERADIITDFSQCQPGTRLILWNDAPAPFPVGTFPVYGKPGEPAYLKEGCVMAFDIQNTASETGLGASLRLPEPRRVEPTQFAALDAQLVDARFNYTLNEGFDEYGRLAQFIGGTTPTSPQLGGFGQHFLDPNTGLPIAYEKHRAGGIEIWKIINTTADTHPMHMHLVDVRVLSRYPFDVSAYKGGVPAPIGPVRPPERNETGRKETVQCPPGEVTTIIMKIDVDKQWVANQRAHYVWHCHILEHEEHDMMRQFDVVP